MERTSYTPYETSTTFDPPPAHPAAGGLTIDTLAAAKRLPASHLRHLGLREWYPSVGRSVVTIPYRGPDGDELAVQHRQALNGADRFFWRKGDKPAPYGLNRLEEARALGSLLIVEGASDCWTAWLYGIPCLGIPGKASWPRDLAPALRGLSLYVWQEPGADDFSARIAHDLPEVRIIVAPNGIKDISDAHIQGLDVVALVERWKNAAIPFEHIRRERAQAELSHNATEPMHF